MDTLHKILDLMWKNGISDAELCSKAGINKSAVTDWKKGKTKSYMKHLPEIAQVLDVSVSYLKDELEEKTSLEENDSLKKLHELINTIDKDYLADAEEILRIYVNKSKQKKEK